MASRGRAIKMLVVFTPGTVWWCVARDGDPQPGLCLIVCVSSFGEGLRSCGCCCRVLNAIAVPTGVVLGYHLLVHLSTWCNLRVFAHPDS